MRLRSPRSRSAPATRRTFYTHYRDIPDFIEQVEANILDEIRARIARVAAADLASLYRNIEELEPHRAPLSCSPI